jgi:hypothetical protein
MNERRKRRATKAEWVATMALIAHHDRDAYREIRREAWESVRFELCSETPN